MIIHLIVYFSVNNLVDIYRQLRPARKQMSVELVVFLLVTGLC